MSRLWIDDDGQDIVEYALISSVLLLLAIGIVKLIGNNSTAVFSTVALKTGN